MHIVVETTKKQQGPLMGLLNETLPSTPNTNQYLCAIDFVVWKVLGVLKGAVWITNDELPELFATLVKDGA